MDDRKKYQQEFNQYEEDAQRDWDEEVRRKFSPQNPFSDPGPQNTSPQPESRSDTPRPPEDRADAPRTSEDRSNTPRTPENTLDGNKYQREFNQYEEDAQRDWDEEVRRKFSPQNPFSNSSPSTPEKSPDDTRATEGHDARASGDKSSNVRESEERSGDTRTPGEQSGDARTPGEQFDQQKSKPPDKHRYQDEFNQFEEDEKRAWEDQMRQTYDTPLNPFESPHTIPDHPLDPPEQRDGKGFRDTDSNHFGDSRDSGNSSDDFWGSEKGVRATRDSFGEDPGNISDSPPKIIFMKSPPQQHNKSKMIKRVVRGTLNEATMYTMSSTSDTHMGRGIKYTYDTVGVYFAIPLTKAVYTGITKGTCFAVHRYMRGNFNKNKEFDFVRSDRFKKVMEPYMRKHTKKIKDRYFEPRSNHDVRILHRTLKSAAREKLGTTNVREIKRMLKTLSGEELEIAKAYLQLSKINKYMEFAHLNVIRMIRGGFRNSVRLAMLGARKMKDNYTMTGVLFTFNLARQALKATYSAYRDVNRISKFAINTVSKTASQAAQMTKISTVLSRTPKTPVPAIKTYGRQSKKVLHTGVRIGRRVGRAGDAFASKILRSGTARAAKINNKILQNVVKKGSKVAELFVRGGTKALIYAINFLLSTIASAIGVLLPFVLAGILIVVIVSTFISIFAMEGDEMESREELTAQQYIEVLDECHEQFKTKLESYYTNSLYETVTVNYVDKKNEAVYRMYENEEGMVVADNNIKECLCLMSALFDFDLESYSPVDEDEATVKERDLANLTSFIERNEQSDEDYSNMTYQWLIRNYLIGLFNGSHEIAENVEVTYCGGCVEMVGEDDTISYYCPGHRHLKLTVTTYYFDKLFDCKIRANSSAYALNGGIITGSSTIETVWYTLLANGFTEEAAAGVIGNLMVESGGAPNDIKLNAVQQGGGDGIGMVQWSGGRHTAFVEFCNSKGVGWPNEDVGIQLEYLLWELNNGQWIWTSIGEGYGSDANISLEEFKKLTDISQATKVWCAKFERCYAHNAHLDWRTNYAKKVYDTYHGKQQGSSGTGLQPGQSATSLGQFRITYYCPCYECSEGYGSMTATGAVAKANHTIAADPSVLPYGTKVLINGTVYTVEDCGGGVKGNHIDIYVDTHAETLQGGSHMSEVFLVK